MTILLTLGKTWLKAKRSDGFELMRQIGNYAKQSIHSSDDMDVLQWWENSPPSLLRQLALIIFRINPHSASVERLFSKLGLIHTKTRNRLNAGTLKKLGMISVDLTQKVIDDKTKNTAAAASSTPPQKKAKLTSNAPYASSEADNLEAVFAPDVEIQLRWNDGKGKGRASDYDEYEVEEGSSAIVDLEEVSIKDFLNSIEHPQPDCPFEKAAMMLHFPARGSTSTPGRPENESEEEWDVKDLVEC